MQIHVVTAGQTLWSIGAQYGVAPGLLARFNGLTEPYRLSVGESLLILKPAQLYTVQPGDSVYSISQMFSLGRNELYRLNPGLSAQERLYPGQVLVTKLEDTPNYEAAADRLRLSRGYQGACCAGFFPMRRRWRRLPTALRKRESCPPGRRADAQRWQRTSAVTTLLHLSTLTEQAASLPSAQVRCWKTKRRARLCPGHGPRDARRRLCRRGVDFEFLGKALAASYAAFLQELSQAVHTAGGYLMAAVAPKTSDTQPGVLYEGHDYAAIGKAVDQVLLMTYEWGYTYGPPMAVAPIDAVERVVRYAVSRIEPGKLLLGFPNYAYDWTLPYEAGLTRAVVIGNEAARQLAFDTRSEIQFDETAQTPWFSYTGMDGAVHEVWFEDVRSSLARFHLVKQYALRGLGYWNFMRPFTANFSLANAALRLPD